MKWCIQVLQHAGFSYPIKYNLQQLDGSDTYFTAYYYLRNSIKNHQELLNEPHLSLLEKPVKSYDWVQNSSSSSQALPLEQEVMVHPALSISTVNSSNLLFENTLLIDSEEELEPIMESLDNIEDF